VRFEVLMVMSMRMAVFRDVVPCNVSITLPDHTVLQPRRQPSSFIFVSVVHRYIVKDSPVI
jgi:hypothetical protein